MADQRPIGFFDSGVGGLTVLRAVLRRLPDESTIYFGDNLRAPYGPRSDAEVQAFSSECLDQLAEREVKAIVVACNTSSAVALPSLRRRYPMPILGVVEPGAREAVRTTQTGHVGVIATQATVRSGAYQRAIRELRPDVTVSEHATPELVPLVEAGHIDGPLVDAAVRRALQPLLADHWLDWQPDPDQDRAVRALIHELDPTVPDALENAPSSESPATLDTLLLGCTHYPLLIGSIRRIAGPTVAVIDSASATAELLADLLAEHDLAAEPGIAVSVHRQLTTGDVDRFRATAVRLFGDLVPQVEGVDLVGVS